MRPSLGSAISVDGALRKPASCAPSRSLRATQHTVAGLPLPFRLLASLYLPDLPTYSVTYFIATARATLSPQGCGYDGCSSSEAIHSSARRQGLFDTVQYGKHCMYSTHFAFCLLVWAVKLIGRAPTRIEGITYLHTYLRYLLLICTDTFDDAVGLTYLQPNGRRKAHEANRLGSTAGSVSI